MPLLTLQDGFALLNLGAEVGVVICLLLIELLNLFLLDSQLLFQLLLLVGHLISKALHLSIDFFQLHLF